MAAYSLSEVERNFTSQPPAVQYLRMFLSLFLTGFPAHSFSCICLPLLGAQADDVLTTAVNSKVSREDNDAVRAGDRAETQKVNTALADLQTAVRTSQYIYYVCCLSRCTSLYLPVLLSLSPRPPPSKPNPPTPLYHLPRPASLFKSLFIRCTYVRRLLPHLQANWKIRLGHRLYASPLQLKMAS